MVFFYGTMSLVIRGWLIPDHGKLYWHTSPRAKAILGVRRSESLETGGLVDEEAEKTKAVANLMLLYVTYIFLISSRFF